MSDNSDAVSEYNGYDIKAPSISEHLPLTEVPQNIIALRIMHSTSLKSMKGLERFSYLQELNLSSNNIEKMDFLGKLLDLRIMDLSCNKIRVINGLNGLFRLEKLNLSHNKIANIQNLKQIATPESNLQHLDLCDNKIQDYTNLLVLNGFEKLTVLTFEQGNNTNPICKKKEFYYETLRNLQRFREFNSIDGNAPKNLIKRELLPEKPENKENLNVNTMENYALPNKKPANSPFKITKLKANMQESAEKNPRSTENENIFLAKESDYKAEIFDLKCRLEGLIHDQRELIYKYESSEKFWSQKCQKLENEFFELMSQAKSHKSEIKAINNENSMLKSQIEQLKKENKEFMVKKEKKEDLIENLQQRITTLLKDSSEAHKELLMKKEENERLRQDLRTNDENIKELKAAIRENEKILASFHSKSLENASISLQRGEELKKKLESLYEENKTINSENSELKMKNSSLLELIKEWEYKYDNKIKEIQYETEQETKKLVDEYEKQIFQLNHQLNFSKKEQEIEFKKNLDLLEDEFKTVLHENNEKFKQIKQVYEEKCKNEADLRSLLRAAVIKNQEQETTIHEFEQILLKIKKDVGEIIAERDYLRNEVTLKKDSKEKELDLLKEEKNKIYNEKQEVESNLNQIKEMRSQELQALSDLRKKAFHYDSITREIDDLKLHIETKTKILEDKNETIESLKEENEALKQNYSSLNEDFQRLSRKFDKQTEIIEELEQQILSNKEENEQMKRDLKEKKGLIKLFEGEIDNIRNTQDTEVDNLKLNLRKKEEKMQDIMKMLDECKINLEKNQELLKEKDQIISSFELKIVYKDNEYKNLSKMKEREIEDLKGKLQENEEEMKILIVEIEKQKRMAKENIEKLNKIFNL